MKLAAAMFFAVALSAACGGRDRTTPTDDGPCGDVRIPIPDTDGGVYPGCGPRRTCNRSGTAPVCVCAAGYTGTDCADCEPGYEVGDDGTCVAVPIDCSRPACVNGACVTRGGIDVCDCPPEYVGRTCALCATGYQDNDDDGTCEATCASSDLVCTGNRVCSDVSGEATCACVPGYAPPGCTECASGWRLQVDGTCVPTCSAIDCGERGRCVDAFDGARCACDVGWDGDRCDACARTHSRDAMGRCVASAPPEGHTLLMAGRADEGSGRSALFALDPARGHAIALSQVEHREPSLACAPGSDVYVGGTYTVVPETGELVEVTWPPDIVTGSRAIALGGTPPRLYSISGVFAVLDPATGGAAVTEYSVSPSWLNALALDVAGTGLYLARGSLESGPGASIASVQLDGRFGPTLPFHADDLARVELDGIAVDPRSGAVYVVGERRPDSTEHLHDYCREVSRALRFDMSSAPVTGEYRYDGAAGATETLTDDPRTPTLVTYGSYSARRAGGTTTLNVETQHPDSFVCIATNYEPIHVVVSASARFKYLVLTAYDPSVSLEVTDGFTPRGTTPPIRVYVRGGTSITSSDAVQVYTREEWSALGITRNGWDSSATYGEPVIFSWDPASGAVHERPIVAEGGLLRDPTGLCPWREL